MSSKPTYKSILLSLSLLSNLLNSQIGEGCYNRYMACEHPGQVRINAIYHPTTNAFVGGCNCGCDFQSIYNPTSPLYCPLPKQTNFDPITSLGDCSCNCPLASPQPSDCISPHIYNYQSCQCECANQLIAATNCPLNQIYNHQTCQCECPDLGKPGFECLDPFFQTIPNSKILSDCSCQCPLSAPSQYDCTAIGREYGLCECLCPITDCPYPNQALNTEMCTCSCPVCPKGAILLNEVTCECGSVETPIIPPPGIEYIAYCCQPMYDNFTPYFGRCWGLTNSNDCENEGRCKWDVTQCFHSKPTCSFRDYKCGTNSECCSQVCRSEGLCR